MDWKSVGLESGAAMRMRAFPPGSLPSTPAGRMEFVHTLLMGFPIVDECGRETGEYSGPLITEEQALSLLRELD